MKEIKAIIQPFMLGHVLDALANLEGLRGLTVSEVTGWGRSRAVDVDSPVVQAGHALASKSKVEIVVTDVMVERVVDTIAKAAYTGNIGDGKIFVVDVVESVKIRTVERDMV